MGFDRDLALDVLSPLAVIAILAWSFGMIRDRRLRGIVAPVSLGLAFGLIAMLQMHLARQPVSGLLVDLRTVPLALAGAFLGWPGLGACLLVALGARSEIGGVGAVPGMIGMALAGLAGRAWDHATRRNLPRGGGQLLLLGAVTSVGLLPGLFLPAPLAQWCRHDVLPLVGLLHLAAVPLLAALLERERQLSFAEATADTLTAAQRRLPRATEQQRLQDAPGTSGPDPVATDVGGGAGHSRLFARMQRMMQHRRGRP